MLPSLHSTLRVVLCPDKVHVLGRTKGRHSAISLQVTLPCCSADHSVPWQAALQTFGYWLKENPQPRARACFILSNRFVRYALVPWANEVNSSQEELALAQAVLADIYGELIDGWYIATADTGYQQPKLAAAIDSELLKSLSLLCDVSSLSLNSIRPWLTVAYSHFLPQLEAASGLFAVEEANQLVTLCFQDKTLTGVRKDVISEVNQLPDCVQREKTYSGLGASVPFYLHTEQRDIPQAKGLVHSLHVSDEHGAFEMALTEDSRQVINLEFHPSRLTASPSGWRLFSFSLLLLVFLSYRYVDLYNEQQKIQSEVARTSAVMQEARNQASDPKILDNLQNAAGVIEQLSFPWNKLFVALESASTNDVALLAVQPDLQVGHITLQGEAKNWSAMVAYLRGLNRQQFFTSVQLTSHQIQQNDPQKPVRFVLQCTWGSHSI